MENTFCIALFALLISASRSEIGDNIERKLLVEFADEIRLGQESIYAPREDDRNYIYCKNFINAISEHVTSSGNGFPIFSENQIPIANFGSASFASGASGTAVPMNTTTTTTI
jgi:hypothetical protein